MSEPNCPKYSMPMRLMRVVPSILPPETGVETLSSPVRNARPSSAAPRVASALGWESRLFPASTASSCSMRW
jgi:hypothetical protein